MSSLFIFGTPSFLSLGGGKGVKGGEYSYLPEMSKVICPR